MTRLPIMNAFLFTSMQCIMLRLLMASVVYMESALKDNFECFLQFILGSIFHLTQSVAYSGFAPPSLHDVEIIS
jgi:hypothetical protein